MSSECAHDTFHRRVTQACRDADLRASVSQVDSRTSLQVGAPQCFQIAPIDLPSQRWFRISVKLSAASFSPRPTSPTILVRSGAGWVDGNEYFQKLAKVQERRTPRLPSPTAEELEWLKQHKEQKDEERKQELVRRESWRIEQAYKAWVKRA
ncbi:MAG: hypothetical protein Q9187_003153, partial [Circinaria calcarea]